MRDESISQAEIDALVRGMTGQSEPMPVAAAPAGSLDMKLLQEPMREFIAQAGRALADLVGMPSQGSLSEIKEMTMLGLEAEVANQILVGRSHFTSGLSGPIHYIVPLSMGLALITQIYGGVAPSALDDSAMGALADGLTQMNQAGLSTLSEHMGRALFAEPVEVVAPSLLSEVAADAAAPVLALGFDLTVGDESGRLFMVIPKEAAGAVSQAVKERQSSKGRAPSPAAPGAGQGAANGIPASVRAAVAAAAAPAPTAPTPYTPAQFPDLAPKAQREEPRNIDLLMDVSLQVTVELGRTRRQIRDVLSLGPGSVLELDKLAGEQVDVLVNGKLIAKGEVVVIDENYGVRITDIISPVDRVQSLK